VIRSRLQGGLRNKAARGALELSLPVGLDRNDGGQITLCADEQVRHAIGRVFELWRRLGSARQVGITLRDEEQLLPRRTVGSRRVRWAQASYGAVHDFLTNPAYAGAFVFGRTAQRKELDEQGRARRAAVPRAGVKRCCRGCCAAGAAAGGCRSPTRDKVQRGELHAVQVTTGRRKGLRIKVSDTSGGLFDQRRQQGGQCEPGSGGPRATMHSLACRKSSCPRCSITVFFDAALEGEVELL